MMNAVKLAKERIFEGCYYCSVCLENKRNVLTNGCNHVSLCDECVINEIDSVEPLN